MENKFFKKIDGNFKGSEEQFKNLMEQAPVSVQIYDMDGFMICASKAWADLWHVTDVDKVIGDFNMLTDPQLIKLGLIDDFKKVFNGEQIDIPFVEFDPSISGFQGEKKYVNIRSFPIKSKDGSISNVVVFNEDVTERNMAERRLIDKKAQLELVMQGGGIGWWDWDIPSGNEIYNDILPELLGYKLNEIEQNIKWWEDKIHPDDLAEVGKDLQEHFDGKTECYKNIHRLKNKAGEWRWFLDYGKVVSKDDEGKPIRMIGILRDVDEQQRAVQILKESEEYFRALIENSSDAISVLDEKGTVIYQSASFEKIMGYAKEERVGQNVLKYIYQDDKKRMLRLFVRKIKIRNAIVKINFRAYHKDGTLRYLEGIAKKLLHSTKVQGVVVNYRDVTKRKRVEKELKQQNKEYAALNTEYIAQNKILTIALEKAKENDRLKTAFLANVSHEIRTPMNGILGFIDLLKGVDLSNEEQQEYIKVIEKSGHRMLNTVIDLMDISKIEAGQVKVLISEVDVNEQIENLYAFFKPEVEEKGLQISFKNTLPGGEAIINTDFEKFYAVFTNLIKNAIKYTPEGSIEFGYVLTGSPQELQFYVKDTGVGVPKDRQKAIFDRFVQADVEDTRAYQGVGLGLAIAKAYIMMLGGSIWLETEVGKGSTFYFTIPNNFNGEKIVEKRETISEKKQKRPVEKLKILIAEDEKVINKYLSIILKKVAKEILYANTGAEAVEMCRENPDIDLVLMDIKMPVMNGYEATRQIRGFNKKVIIISQTGFAMSGDREKAMKAGCNDYVAKPIKKKILMTMIEKHMFS